MKKALLICILGFCLTTPLIASENSKVCMETVLQNDWEKLGTVKVYNEYWSAEVTLFVKVIGEKLFYRIFWDGKYYSVSVGEFELKGKKYNAKAGGWYLNV